MTIKINSTAGSHSIRAFAALTLIAAIFLASSCDDPMTAVIAENVRVASLPDRVLIIQGPSDGTVSPSAGNYDIKEGEPFSISATANGGYSFLFWEQLAGSGTASFDDNTAASTTVRVTGGDATIRARIDDTNYDITITAQTGGTVSPLTINLDQGIESAGNIVASPAAGYSFVNWTVPAGLPTGIAFNPNANTASVKITANAGNATVQANFQDTQGPTGTVAIQGKILVDATYWSKTKTVTVNLTASDNSGSVALVKLSETDFGTGTSTGWTAMDLSKTFTFASDGSKTLYVRFKDAAGNESGSYTDTISVDSTPPVPSRYQVELISNPGTYPEYVTTYTSTTLQLSYLATDAGCGVKNVYFSNTTTRPTVPQVTEYLAVPPPYPWTISTYDDHNYYNVHFWFEDKLGNISTMFTEPIKYDDKYEFGKGNNTFAQLDAISGPTIIIDTYSSTPTWSYTYASNGYSYLVDPDYYKWGFYPLDSNNTYPVEIIIDVNAAGVMPDVTFYNHNRVAVGATRTYPYLGNANKAQYTLDMPYIDTVQEYFFYMRVQKNAEPTPPYAQRPNYSIWWTFDEDQGM